jgi:predicted lipoprotein with Yx(FWY)xxD motif
MPTTVVTEPPMTESPVATESPVVSETAVATESPAATEPGGTGVPVTGEATVNVANVGTFGQALVNGEGMALYAFSLDTGGTSACTGDCATEWVPLASQGSPVAGTGVDATKLSTITRDDGTMQVTYNGHPLYTFESDTAAGDATGQAMDDFGGTWTLVSPTGDLIQ